MRVLVSGGGTGGHIYPALAIATQLRTQHQAEILFLGSDDGLENEIVPAAGFRLKTFWPREPTRNRRPEAESGMAPLRRGSGICRATWTRC